MVNSPSPLVGEGRVRGRVKELEPSDKAIAPAQPPSPQPSPKGRGSQKILQTRALLLNQLDWASTRKTPVMNLPARDALASIIIPCWNQLEFTRFCLPALVRHTRLPWELIVVDNGSTDGTGTYLAGVQDVAPVPVTVMHNERNAGFPAAINQGLKAARGDYLVLLNNDAVVTDGWLSQLVALAEMDLDVTTKNAKDTKGENGIGDGDGMRIGMVGPMSNYASPPQLVENVPYSNLEEMQAFARRFKATASTPNGSYRKTATSSPRSGECQS